MSNGPISICIWDKEIKLHYFALVIRNKALDQKYKGGSLKFRCIHYCCYNDYLTTLDRMSQQDLYDEIDEIVESGLVNEKDFIWFYAMHGDMKGPEDFDLEVDWLKAYILEGSTIVRCTDETESPMVICPRRKECEPRYGPCIHRVPHPVHCEGDGCSIIPEKFTCVPYINTDLLLEAPALGTQIMQCLCEESDARGLLLESRVKEIIENLLGNYKEYALVRPEENHAFKYGWRYMERCDNCRKKKRAYQYYRIIKGKWPYFCKECWLEKRKLDEEKARW